MNREEYRRSVEAKVFGEDYSHTPVDHKMLLVRVADLLAACMLSPEAEQRMRDIFRSKRFDLPGRLDPDRVEEIEDFDNRLVHYDILDDGEVHLLRDPGSGAYVMSGAYDFYDTAEQECRAFGIDFGSAEVLGLDCWEGLAHLETLLKAVLSGDFFQVRALPFRKLKPIVDRYHGKPSGETAGTERT